MDQNWQYPLVTPEVYFLLCWAIQGGICVGSPTLVLDLGTFYLNSVQEAEAALPCTQKHFEVAVKDIMTYLVNDDFSWTIVDDCLQQGQFITKKALNGDPLIVPVLDRMGFAANVLIDNIPGSFSTP